MSNAFQSISLLSFFSLNPINQSIKIRSINQLASAERWEMKLDEKEINESYNQQSQIRVSWQSINQINQSTNQLMLFWFYFHQSFTIDSWFHLTSNNQSLIKYQSVKWVNERKKEKVRFENHHQINQSQIQSTHKSTNNQPNQRKQVKSEMKSISFLCLTFFQFPINQSTNQPLRVSCLFVCLFVVSIVSHLNWCLICFACWNQFNFPFIQSINQVWWWWWWISIDCDNKQINQQSFSLSFACLFQFPFVNFLFFSQSIKSIQFILTNKRINQSMTNEKNQSMIQSTK